MKKYSLTFLFVVAILGFVSSCSDEPDSSNFYTFKGQMMSEYLYGHEEFSDFTKIVERAGMMDLLATYGAYTCFPPTNDAVKAYLNKFADMLSDDSAGFDVYRTKKLNRVEDDEALRSYIDSRLDMTADISDMTLQRDVIAQFGDTYPAMKPKDWMHLIHTYISHEDIEEDSYLLAADPLNKPKEDDQVYRAQREERAAYDDFIASLDMADN